ncbi:hypothetical protein [Paenibacillus oceani]|uniref:Uncharacterized protein n=1 Tax=Paenibacillus oceani TaxID=2772510 RepID=A0A927CCH5_9BACL|nr:hypothetical protein [Paenibacillus oceani]MBD2863441.1 hypothetical protein [Paenibacillus oceani]
MNGSHGKGAWSLEPHIQRHIRVCDEDADKGSAYLTPAEKKVEFGESACIKLGPGQGCFRDRRPSIIGVRAACKVKKGFLLGHQLQVKPAQMDENKKESAGMREPAVSVGRKFLFPCNLTKTSEKGILTNGCKERKIIFGYVNKIKTYTEPYVERKFRV